MSNTVRFSYNSFACVNVNIFLRITFLFPNCLSEDSFDNAVYFVK